MIRAILVLIALANPLCAQDVTLPSVSQIRNDPRLDLDWVPPRIMMDALAAAEDPTWFTSFPANSPISRQVAKTYIPDGTRTILRRTMELKLAVDLANEFTPDEIISIYAQTIWLGARCFGVQNALEYRLGRSTDSATLRDVVTLAALIRAPTIYGQDQQQFSDRFEYVAGEGQRAGIWDDETAKALIEGGPSPLIASPNCPN